jgi:hypothetical protein
MTETTELLKEIGKLKRLNKELLEVLNNLSIVLTAEYDIQPYSTHHQRINILIDKAEAMNG